MSSTNVNVSNTKNSEVTSSPKLNGARPSESDKTCVVCFKIVDIFSIGECDHPVCYECSTSKSSTNIFLRLENEKENE